MRNACIRSLCTRAKLTTAERKTDRQTDRQTDRWLLHMPPDFLGSYSGTIINWIKRNKNAYYHNVFVIGIRPYIYLVLYVSLFCAGKYFSNTLKMISVYRYFRVPFTLSNDCAM